MKNILALLPICVLLVACSDDEDSSQRLDFGKFTMKAPLHWNVVEVQGYDSYVRELRMSQDEFAYVDLGMFSSELPADPEKHDIKMMIIDGHVAKVVDPKQVKEGSTGVFFHDVDGMRLTISGYELSEVHQRQLLSAIRTIRFK